MKTLYNVLKPIAQPLKEAYKCGAKIPAQIFRNLEIYEEFTQMNEPKMARYIILAEKHKVSEVSIRKIIRELNLVTKE